MPDASVLSLFFFGGLPLRGLGDIIPTPLFLFLCLCFPLQRDLPLLGTLACPRIGARSLTSHRKSFLVTDPAITPDFDESLYIIRNFRAKCSLDQIILLDLLPYLINILIGKVLYLAAGIDLCVLQNRPGNGPPDPEYVSEGDFNALVLRQINACNSCQKNLLADRSLLALALLVLWILAYDPNPSFPLDDLAVRTHFLNRCTYFHIFFLTYIYTQFFLSSYHMARALR